MVILWNVYSVWENETINKQNIIDASKKTGMRPDIIERVIALYDTIYQVMNADIKQTFIGGSMINQVYIDPDEARLSIDVDTVVRESIERKSELIDIFVDLREKMLKNQCIYQINIGNSVVYIGEISSDTKRQDLYPKVLFLKRSIPSFFVGTPLSNYLNKLGLTSKNKNVNKFLMNLKKELGYLPKIYDVRIEISFDKEGINYPFKKSKVHPYFKNTLTPHKIFSCEIEEASSVAEGKIEFLNIIDEIQTINIINTICDLRIIYLYDLDIKIPEKTILKVEKIMDKCQTDFEKYWFYKLISSKYTFHEIFKKIIGSRS